LFVPAIGYGDAQFSQSSAHPKTMFGAKNVDTELLSMASKALRAQFVDESANWKDVEAMELFGAKLGNDLLMTKPEVVVVENPAAELDSLFLDLVGTDKVGRLRRQRTEMPDLSPLKQLKMEGVKLDENVFVPIPGWGEQKFDFGFQNGSYNLIDKGAFPANLSQAKEKASTFGAKGQLLHKATENDAVHNKLIVVANFSEALSTAALDDIAIILKGCNTEIVRADELTAFVERVRQEAHD
jgi:hypothetical protein